jgi:signal transducer and activator of transcription 5B
MEITTLRNRITETENLRRTIHHEQEQFCIQYQELGKLTTYLSSNGSATGSGSPANPELIGKVTKEKQMLECTLKQQVAQICRRRQQLLDRLSETLAKISQLQQQLLGDHLIAWRRAQQLAGNGRAVSGTSIDQLQEWCEGLADIIWQNRQEVVRVEEFCNHLQLPNTPEIKERALMLRSQYSALLSALVYGSFVIEKQPPQVMKTNTRFTSTVRLLVGVKLNVHMTPPLVKVAIISESQANALIRTKKMGSAECSGEILNNAATMEYNGVSRQLGLHFRNMQLKKIKRAEKKGTESVMDEKFALLFHSQFKIGTSETFEVWVSSAFFCSFTPDLMLVSCVAFRNRLYHFRSSSLCTVIKNRTLGQPSPGTTHSPNWYVPALSI